MADQIPINIPIPTSPVISTITFNELLTGQGILEIYPGEVYPTTKILTTNSVFSAPTHFVTINETESIDLDFDITVGKSFTIDAAPCIFNVPITLVSTISDTNADDVVFTIRKFDGSTETDVGTVTISYSESVVNGETSYMLSGKIDCTLTHYKVGDILRITYAMTMEAEAGTASIKLGIDPANRTDTNFDLGTRSTFYIPIRNEN